MINERTRATRTVASSISFDAQVGAGRDHGLELPVLHQALKTLLAASNFSALTVTETNPAHAPDEEPAFERLIAVLADSLSGAFLGSR